MSRPFQLGTHASPWIVVITNGPAPALIVCTTSFDDGPTTAIEFLRICGTQIRPFTTSGSPRNGAPARGTVVTTELVFGSMRVSPVGEVIQTASVDAAVQPPPLVAIRASTLCETGSTRITPGEPPVAQTDPNAATTPVAVGSFQRFTTLFRAGSMRSSSPWP